MTRPRDYRINNDKTLIFKIFFFFFKSYGSSFFENLACISAAETRIYKIKFFLHFLGLWVVQRTQTEWNIKFFTWTVFWESFFFVLTRKQRNHLTILCLLVFFTLYLFPCYRILQCSYKTRQKFVCPCFVILIFFSLLYYTCCWQTFWRWIYRLNVCLEHFSRV